MDYLKNALKIIGYTLLGLASFAATILIIFGLWWTAINFGSVLFCMVFFSIVLYAAYDTGKSIIEGNGE